MLIGTFKSQGGIIFSAMIKDKIEALCPYHRIVFGTGINDIMIGRKFILE